MFHSALLHSALGFFAPSICLLCRGEEALDGLCEACRMDLPLTKSACERCGVSLACAGLCAKCMRKPPNYDRVLTAYAYRSPVSQLIRALKYNQRLEFISAVGEGLIRLLKARQEDPPKRLIPVPLHGQRLMQRGFNQSLELARLLGRRLAIKIDPGLVRRIRATAPQFELSPKARQANVRGAFALRRPPPYESVAIVDDIVTSGATVNELARLLKRAGVKDISVWALARTG